MNGSSTKAQFERSLCCFAAFAIFSLIVRPATMAGEQNATKPDSKSRHAVAQIECITPDGRISPVPSSAQNAPATLKEDDTISCPLREGKTVFIIAFSKIAVLDGFTLINENAGACGELRIAVSNSPLAANSPAWTVVDGAIPFARKRLFNLSMLGVEAKYVRLSFHVNSSGVEVARRTPDIRLWRNLMLGYIGF